MTHFVRHQSGHKLMTSSPPISDDVIISAHDHRYGVGHHRRVSSSRDCSPDNELLLRMLYDRFVNQSASSYSNQWLQPQYSDFHHSATNPPLLMPASYLHYPHRQSLKVSPVPVDTVAAVGDRLGLSAWHSVPEMTSRMRFRPFVITNHANE